MAGLLEFLCSLAGLRDRSPTLEIRVSKAFGNQKVAGCCMGNLGSVRKAPDTFRCFVGPLFLQSGFSDAVFHHMWILQGFCREFCCGFLRGLSFV